jgi:hypothetical protein
VTSDFKWRSITVHLPGEEVGPKEWRVRADVFRRDRLDTPDRVEKELVGSGPTMNSARDDAYRQAKRFVKSQGKPLDWAGR